MIERWSHTAQRRGNELRHMLKKCRSNYYYLELEPCLVRCHLSPITRDTTFLYPTLAHPPEPVTRPSTHVCVSNALPLNPIYKNARLGNSEIDRLKQKKAEKKYQVMLMLISRW